MSIIAKSQSLSRQLKDNLAKRLPTYTISESLDSQGARLLISADSSPAAGEQVVAIRIKGQDTQFSNVIGQAQTVYTPMVAQVIEEASASAGVALLTHANQCMIDWELARLGIKQERYLNANTTAVALSQYAADGSVTGSSLVATISDLYWPLSGQ